MPLSKNPVQILESYPMVTYKEFVLSVWTPNEFCDLEVFLDKMHCDRLLCVTENEGSISFSKYESKAR